MKIVAELYCLAWIIAAVYITIKEAWSTKTLLVMLMLALIGIALFYSTIVAWLT